MVNEKYKEITTISEFAGLLNITPDYLNIVVKETTGQTAIDLQRKRIILECRNILRNSLRVGISVTGWGIGG